MINDILKIVIRVKNAIDISKIKTMTFEITVEITKIETIISKIEIEVEITIDDIFEIVIDKNTIDRILDHVQLNCEFLILWNSILRKIQSHSL